MTSGSIILSHSGDSCFACCVARVFWVVSVIVLSSFIICGPPYSGTHTKSLMCINAEEGVKAKDQKNPLLQQSGVGPKKDSHSHIVDILDFVC